MLLLLGCVHPPPPAPPPAVEPPPPPTVETAYGALPGVVLSEPPEWASQASCGTPQPVEAEALFSEARTTPPGDLTDGMLLCRVVLSSEPPTGRRWDIGGGAPDQLEPTI